MLALYLEGEVATTMQIKTVSSSTKESKKTQESCQKFHLHFVKNWLIFQWEGEEKKKKVWLCTWNTKLSKIRGRGRGLRGSIPVSFI